MSSMNDETIQDLKQFIAATVSQQTSDIIKRLDGVDERLDGIDTRLDRVETKIDDLSASVAEALDATHEVTHSQLQDHERRIVRLEQNAA